MKKISTLLFLLILSGTLSAQVFWTEDFGSTCRFRGHATTFSDANGAWTETQIGENDATGNEWYVSDRATFDGDGNCASGSDLACASSPNNSLHVGGLTMPVVDYLGFPVYPGAPEDSASYWTGYFYQFDATKGAITDKRIESPAINCTGQSNISISFDFYHGGDLAGGTNGDCKFWYYDGTTWTMLLDMPKTQHGGCNSGVLGNWVASSGYPALATLILPASANGNPNVKIGFEWSNDNSSGGNGDDPSFAVDNIKLSSGSAAAPPVAKFSSASTSGCATFCASFTDSSTNNPTSWSWTFTGSITPTSTLQNPTACYSTSGMFPVKLVVTNSGGADSITISNYINVLAGPPTPTITQGHDTLYCSYNAAYTSYQWDSSGTNIAGATLNYYVITKSGTYDVKVSNVNGCQVGDGITVTYVGIQNYSFEKNSVSIFPSPATDILTVTGNWQASDGMLSVYDILGKKVITYAIRLDSKLSVNVNELPQGIYFLKIENPKGEWIGKFEKE